MSSSVRDISLMCCHTSQQLQSETTNSTLTILMAVREGEIYNI